jgi:hypothetical protein
MTIVTNVNDYFYVTSNMCSLYLYSTVPCKKNKVYFLLSPLFLYMTVTLSSTGIFDGNPKLHIITAI